MASRRPAEVFPPGEYLRDELEKRGWTQADLADILGRPVRLVNEILMGKRGISPETARGLAAALGTSPEFWMGLEASYQLWHAQTDDVQPVARKARLYGRAPVKEMVRRRWIEQSDSIDVLEHEVLTFLGIQTLDEPPAFAAAARMSAPEDTVTFSHQAWFCRAKQLAAAVKVSGTPLNLEQTIDRLMQLVEAPQDLRHVPRVLADGGIRLVVVEHLHGTKIDGACFWLDSGSPVIAVSLRYGRIDSFWFTLMHELGHIFWQHDMSVDDDLLEAASQTQGRAEDERQADEFASEHLIPRATLDNFIARVRPLYSKAGILGFAATLHVHPGIVVGQLQHRKELAWTSFRDLLVSVREWITGSALTDGWGSQLPTLSAPSRA